MIYQINFVYQKWVYNKGQISVVRMAKLTFWTLALRQNEDRNCRLCLRLSVLPWGRETPQVVILLVEWLGKLQSSCVIAISTSEKNRSSTREKLRLSYDIELNTRREIPYLQATMYYSLCNLLSGNWIWPIYQLQLWHRITVSFETKPFIYTYAVHLLETAQTRLEVNLVT